MSQPEILQRSWRTIARRRTTVLSIAVLLVAVWSVRTEKQTFADLHGAGPWVQALGLVAGVTAGLAVWDVAQARFTAAGAGLVAVAAASVFAALPGQLAQTGQLLHHYADMPSARAEQAGGHQIPSTDGRPEPFEAIRRSIPEDETYVLYADQFFDLWAHYRLLPRIAVPSLAGADWAVFHNRNWHSRANRLIHVRRIEAGTWIGRVKR